MKEEIKNGLDCITFLNHMPNKHGKAKQISVDKLCRVFISKITPQKIKQFKESVSQIRGLDD